MPAPSATMPEGGFADRSWRWLTSAAVAVYALALVATLPAKAVVPPGIDAAGTVWRGEAAVGGHVAAWQASLVKSLARLGIAGEWHIDGDGSALAGTARWRPGSIAVDGVAGRVGWGLISLAAPSLPFVCDLDGHVALDWADSRTARGSVTTEAGTCSAKTGGAPRSVPRLVMNFVGSAGTVVPWANRAPALAEWKITSDVMHLHISAAGAALMPGTPGASDVEIEL